MTACVYTKGSSNGYEVNWKTECGNRVVCEVPTEVGFQRAPLPNETGKFCHFCGKKIQLKEKNVRI